MCGWVGWVGFESALKSMNAGTVHITYPHIVCHTPMSWGLIKERVSPSFG